MFKGDSLAFAELRFRTFIQGKPPLPNIIRCALKMFSIYNSQEPSKLRVNVFKVCFHKFCLFTVYYNGDINKFHSRRFSMN